MNPVYDIKEEAEWLRKVRPILLNADLSQSLVIYDENTSFRKEQILHAHDSTEIVFCFTNNHLTGEIEKLSRLRLTPAGIRHAAFTRQYTPYFSMGFNQGTVFYTRRGCSIETPLQSEFTEYGLDIKNIAGYLETFCRNPDGDLDHLRIILCSLISALYKIISAGKLRLCNETAAKICHYIMQNYSRGNLTIVEVANAVNLSPNYLQRIFYKEMNCTPKEYLLRVRLNAARILLKQHKYLIKEVAQMCGWNCSHYFSNTYCKFYGYFPSDEI